MKVSAILAVLLLVAGMSSASLVVYNDAPVLLGTVPAGSAYPPAGQYYGVTLHFASTDPNYKPASFNVTITGTVLQWTAGNRGTSPTTSTFWLDEVTAQLNDSIGYGADMLPKEALFDSHMLVNHSQLLTAPGTIGEGAPTLFFQAVSDASAAFFGEDPLSPGYGARPKAALENWMVQPGTPTATFSLMTPVRQQDLSFAYLVIPAGGSVHMTGDMVLNDGGPSMIPVLVDYTVSIPEPATMTLLALGAVGLVMRRRRA